MKQACWLAAMVVGMAVAARAESYSIVQLTDMNRDVTFQVVSSTELRDLKKQMDAEEKFFQKAKELVAKDWAARIAAERKANEKNAPKTPPFPGSQLRERVMSVMPRTYMKRDEADKAVQALEERAARTAFAKQELENKASKGLKVVNHEKELALSEAVSLLKAKIEELKGTAAPAAPAAVPAAAPAAVPAAVPATPAARGAK